MAFRIYIDESGTHDADWLLIGILFVPNHGPLHADLCKVKEDLKYFNNKPKRNARYKETHLTDFRAERDFEVAKRWMDVFLKHDCYFRAVVIDWSIWDGRHFGDAFEADALKKRRAYKKWAEMLLHPELKEPLNQKRIKGAELYLDKLRILHGYDIIPELEERFTGNYEGSTPYIAKFQHTDSWLDANQCLQLCDLLTGALYQSLCPSKNQWKQATVAYIANALKPCGVRSMGAGFWRQYHQSTLRNHHPKFCAWFWKPSEKEKGKRGRRGGRR